LLNLLGKTGHARASLRKLSNSLLAKKCGLLPDFGGQKRIKGGNSD